MRLGRKLLPISLLATTALVLSGCSVLEDWGLISPSGEVVELTPESVPDPSADAGAVPTSPGTADGGFVLPPCDTLYSSGQNTALIDAGMFPFGETSEGDFGYGTTNLDLVKILQGIRTDLRISCTWVLQAGESASVTTAAVITADVNRDVRGLLTSGGGSGEEIGGGFAWTVESPLSEVSPDVEATEVHYLASITCPASVADEECFLWVSTNYTFGNARILTLDAATNLGAVRN
jgi:hypothetical protein